MDGKETNDQTQAKIKALWDKVTQDTFHELSDYKGYNREFLQLFGFEFDGVDYEADVDTLKPWIE
jgi:enoyl-[acyl-carrier protein] reductase/trans-2-enoyl-CoA reductase (NAD+)